MASGLDDLGEDDAMAASDTKYRSSSQFQVSISAKHLRGMAATTPDEIRAANLRYEDEHAPKPSYRRP
jgi:hypothetical protein